MAYLNYTTKTTDTTDDLINLGLNEYGLIIDGQKTTAGAPDTNTEKYVPGAFIQNTATSTWYQNTGSTVLPIWTVVSGGGTSPAAPNTAVQWNNAGSFGGSASFTWDEASQSLSVVGSGNSTTLTLNDPLQLINAQTLTGGVGSSLQMSTAGAHLRWSSGAALWGFQASQFNGGETHIISNNVTWTWPQADGLGNQALSTDGAGNLIWQSIGGGTVIGNGTLGQVTFWSGVSSITGSTDFLWDNTNRVFSVGDLGSAVNSTIFTVDDPNSQISFGSFINVGAANAVFNTSTHTANINFNSINLGDSNSSGNDTVLAVDDTAETVRVTVDNLFGVRGTNLNGWFEVSPVNRYVFMGDLSGLNSNTSIQLDDAARTIISSTQQAGVGGRAGVSATSAGFEYSDGVGTWSWFADDTAGGTAQVQSGSTVWAWPQADGLTGQVLTTDGAGNLDFAYAGTGDIGALNVRVATTAVLPGAPTYNNGVAGVGATLTRSSNGTLGTIDGITPFSIGDRILVKNQASTLENGVYEVTTVGSAGVPYVLTRTTDADTTAALDDMVVIASLGSTNKGIPFGQQTNNPTIGVSAIVFTQTSIYLKQQTSGTQAINQIPVYTATARTLTKGTSSFTYSPTTNLLSIGGVVRSSDLHNNALAQGNATQQDIRSGTYTPTGTVGTNVTSVTPSTAQWLRIGNVVTVSGHTLVNVTAAATCDWELSIPVNSTWSNSGNVGGTASRATGGTVDSLCFLQATTNNRVQFLANTVASGIHVFSYQYTYVVI